MHGKLRILVVDDERDIAAIMKKGLERAGYTVDAFTNPQEALNHFKVDYYALAITDISMPVMNGFELYRELKKKDGKIKVVFMTAFDIYEEEFKKIFKSTTVDGFMKKPITLTSLVESVRKILSTSS